MLRIPQSLIITGGSPSDPLVLYPGHLSEESYSSAEMQSMYSAAPDNSEKKQWTIETNGERERERERERESMRNPY